MAHEIKYDEHGEAYIGIEIEVKVYIDKDDLEEMEMDPPEDYEVFEMFSDMERVDLGEQVLNEVARKLGER